MLRVFCTGRTRVCVAGRFGARGFGSRLWVLLSRPLSSLSSLGFPQCGEMPTAHLPSTRPHRVEALHHDSTWRDQPRLCCILAPPAAVNLSLRLRDIRPFAAVVRLRRCDAGVCLRGQRLRCFSQVNVCAHAMHMRPCFAVYRGGARPRLAWSGRRANRFIAMPCRCLPVGVCECDWRCCH